MSVVRVSSTGGEPLTAVALREHVRGLDDDDSELSAMATAARELIETRTRRSLIPNSQYRMTLDRWPGRVIELPRSPLTSSTSVAVTYFPDGGSEQTVPAASYVVDADSVPPRVVLGRDQTWPDATLRSANGVKVTWRAGSTSVPETAKHAIRMLVGHWFENREAVLVGTISKELEMGLDALVWSLKVPD